MDTETALIVGGCGLLAVILLIMLLGAWFAYRLLRINVVNALMGWFMRGDDTREPADPYANQSLPRRRADDLRERAQSLDFDQAVQKYQRTQPEITITGAPQVAPSPDVEERPMNTSSPIDGRTFRDGRDRRVTGGTPGQVSDGEFKRVEGGDPPGGYPELPPPPTSRPLRKPRREPNPDEIFGGMLDEDGDGTIDF